MKNAVKILRWLMATPLVVAAFLLLVAGIIFFTFFSTIKEPGNIKHVFRSAEIYEKGPDLALDLYFTKVKDEVRKSGRELTVDEILGNRLAEEDLRKGLKEIFPPEWLQTETEKIIDVVYGSFEGELNGLSYSLNLESRMEKAGDVFATYLKGKLAALPVCAGKTVNNNFDLFTASGRPPSINLVAANEEIDTLSQNIKQTKLDKQFTTLTPEAQSHLLPLQRILKVLPHVAILLTGVALLILSLGIFFIPGNKAKWLTVMILVGAIGLFTLLVTLGLLTNIPDTLVNRQIKMHVDSDQIPVLTPIIKSALEVLKDNLALRMGLITLIAAVAGFMLQIRPQYQVHIKKVFGVIMISAILLIVFTFVRIKNLGFFQ